MMARIRTLKPQLPSDVTLARCSIEARYLFLLLISQADDYGLVEAAPRQLLGQLFPHDDDVTAADVARWAQELAERGVIRWRETDDGAPVIEITNWAKHQVVKNPGKPLLLNSLKPLVGNPPAILPQSSRNPTEGCRKNSCAEGEGEGEVGRGEGKGKGKREGDVVGSDDRDDDDGNGDWVDRFPEAYRETVAAACRAARNPVALRAEFEAIATGMHPPVYDYATLGRAVHEMAVAGAPMRPSVLRAFCRRLTTPTTEPLDERLYADA